MFRLTREVRFAINARPDDQLDHPPSNSYGGYPSLNGLGFFLVARVTLRGDLDPSTQYLLNIKSVDETTRDFLRDPGNMVGKKPVSPAEMLGAMFGQFHQTWQDRFEGAELLLSPCLSISMYRSELPMMRLSQKFEFCASHRLHNPQLDAEQNAELYGKCNNPNGHGHNYEVQVTLRGKPTSPGGLLVDVPAFERIVKETVIDRFDHRNLNTETTEFRELIPTVENISMVVYRLLKDRIANLGADLAGVTVWETAKTWCEYSE